MIIKLIMVFIILFLYLHIYIHLYVCKNNILNRVSDVNNNEITNTIYNKLPFLFKSENLITKLELQQCIKENNIYIKPYENYKLLEPRVKFFTNNLIYNNGIFLYYNLHCRNFYKCFSNSIIITLIHPKYIDNFKTIKNCSFDTNEKYIKYINKSKLFIKVKLTKGEVLFVPNYWIIYYNLTKDDYIEHIQYSTILNQSSFFFNWVNNNNLKNLYN